MAHPKRRHSKTRRDNRRAHDKISTPELIKCSQCGAMKLTHRICLKCGYYNGKQVLDVPKKEPKKKRK